MKRKYITPVSIVCKWNTSEIFTLKSGEVEVILCDDWYE